MLKRWRSAAQLWLAGKTYNLAEAVDKILENSSTGEERDRELRKLLAKYAPCPVEGSTWSVINALDFDFEGFQGQHLSDYTAAHRLLDVAHVSHTPSLLVIRDLGLAAKLAYEDPNVIKYICQSWKMETNLELFLTFKQTHAFIMYDQQNIVLTFRGTDLLNAKEWATDFQVKLVPMRAHASNGANPDEASERRKPLAHAGFLEAIGLVDSDEILSPYAKICEILSGLLNNDSQKKIWVTGHSLGAALASVFVAQLILDNDVLLDNLGGLYTYGQPRSGDAEYCKLFTDLVKHGLVYRAVNKKDLVPKIPVKLLDYSHHGCKLSIQDKKLVMMKKKGEEVELKSTLKNVLPKDSGLKKLVFALLPDMVEDHYPFEYVRNVQIFI